MFFDFCLLPYNNYYQGMVVIRGNEAESKINKYSLPKIKKERSIINMIKETDVDEIKDMMVKSSKLNKKINVNFYIDEFGETVQLPMSIFVKRVGDNLIEVSSQSDAINDIEFLISGIESCPLLQMESMLRTLKSTIKAIKKYSEGAYKINVEQKQHFFSYSLILSGKTFGDVINKIIKMYKEVSAENSLTYDEIREELING